MSIEKRIFLFLLIFLWPALFTCFGQIQENPVQWKTTIEKGKGDTLLVSLTATIKEGWHINSQFNAIQDWPLPTVFDFEKSNQYFTCRKSGRTSAS